MTFWTGYANFRTRNSPSLARIGGRTKLQRGGMRYGGGGNGEHVFALLPA